MRSSGVLMHISSLPSPYGIGTMGRKAFRFIDFLKKAGQSYWQLLPICPTSFGDSPYQSFSGYAGNSYFIDLELLCEEGLLTREECESYNWGEDKSQVDYEKIYFNRNKLLHKVYEVFKEKKPTDFDSFCESQKTWLEDYTLFMALKEINQGKAWMDWEEPLKRREPAALEDVKHVCANEICFWKMVQYLFFKQWDALKTYAHENGIQIIGDVPIYVAADSVDVWSEPEQFYLDEDLRMIDVAGCPPDVYAVKGQLWGNPLFNWDKMKEDQYAWWTRRIAYMSKLYDVVRVDHFRGFDSYYAIPTKDKDAVNGEWRKGPGMELFHALEKKLGKQNIIVEDLGFLTDSVRKLVKDTGFPGMKLVQFGFNGGCEDGDYLPHNYDKHCVVYTGTHDNDTILGWMNQASEESAAFAKEYLRLSEEEGYNWGMMRAAWSSVGELAIVTMQDLLGLGSEARMNIPSTLGCNWKWRVVPGQITEELAEKTAKYVRLYGRSPQ